MLKLIILILLMDYYIYLIVILKTVMKKYGHVNIVEKNLIQKKVLYFMKQDIARTKIRKILQKVGKNRHI